MYAVAAFVTVVPLLLLVGSGLVTWQWRQAVAARAVAEADLYLKRVALAQRDWLAGDVGRAEALLAACPAERRGWEWHYLTRLCHADLRTLRGHADWITAVAVTVLRSARARRGRG